MKAISYTMARNNLAKTMEKVCKDHNPIIVSRRNNESVVIISLDDYESLNESSYLLQSPKNKKRLMDSIKELNNGKGKERELIR